MGDWWPLRPVARSTPSRAPATMEQSSPCAHRPTWGPCGVSLSVDASSQAEDMFYNIPQRRKALQSASDEYHKILDVISKYAIHNEGVSITCKKVLPLTILVPFLDLTPLARCAERDFGPGRRDLCISFDFGHDRSAVQRDAAQIACPFRMWRRGGRGQVPMRRVGQQRALAFEKVSSLDLHQPYVHFPSSSHRRLVESATQIDS